MKRSRSSRTVSASLAAFGLTTLVFTLSQCGAGLGEPTTPPTPPSPAICGEPPQSVCRSADDCSAEGVKPRCAQEVAMCEDGQCQYQPLVQTGCPCVEFTTQTCTKADHTPGRQACGKMPTDNDATGWCDCK